MLTARGETPKLILWLTVLLSVGFAATSLASYFVSRNSIRNEIIHNELPLTADNVYSEIQKDLIRPILISSAMAHDAFLHDWALAGEQKTENITKYLQVIRDEYATVTAFFISDRTRLYYHADGVHKKIAENDARDSWYFRVRSLKAPYEINVDTDYVNQDNLTVFINYRVTDHRGKFIGATGVGLTADAVRRLIDHYQERYRRNIYFTDRQGKVVLHGKDRTSSGNSIYDIEGLRGQVPAILRQNEGTYQYRHGGRRYQINARFVPELGWYLFVEKAEDEAFTDIRHTLFLNLGICAAITGIVLLLTHLSIGSYQNRLKWAIEARAAELNHALDKANTANQAKNQMLAYISHDLRAPLTTISHYMHRLNTDSGENVRQYQTAIKQSIAHQLELIDDLTEYALGELEHLKLLPVPTFLYSFLHGIADQGELLAVHQANRFTIELSDDLPPVAVFDAKRLKQILMNLLSNAAKFTMDGEIRLQVQVVHDDTANNSLLRFTIADDGPGIAAEDRTSIFLPYERRQSGRAGVGLGLTIAYQIARKMGSELKVDSALGKGSRFWFDVVVGTAQEADVLQPIDALPLFESFGTGRRILIAGDDAAILDYAREILSLADFDVVCSKDVDEMAHLIGSAPVDAVLFSQSGSGRSAWDMLRTLRDRQPGAAPPVILCCAMPPQRPVDFPDGADFHAILFKPVSASKLIHVLQAQFKSGSCLEASTAPLAAIPAPELEVLRRMITLGNISGIEEWAISVESRNPEHADFAGRLRDAALRIDFAELTMLTACPELSEAPGQASNCR